MQIGDPKKAIVLAIVAVIVLGIAAFQLFPKAQHFATVMRERSEGQAPTTVQPQDQRRLPDVVTSSPFIKLKPPQIQPAQKPPPLSGSLPAAGTVVEPDGNTPLTPNGPFPNGLPGINPVENTGSDQQLGKKTATLRAILRVQGRTAVFEFRGFKNQQNELLNVGSWLQGYRVIEMRDHEIALMDNKGKRINLKVGTTLNL